MTLITGERTATFFDLSSLVTAGLAPAIDIPFRDAGA
jgi:hypothetical protein